MKNLKSKLQKMMRILNFGIFNGKKLKKKEPIFIAIFLGLIGISGFALMLWITPYGAGVTPDSIIYLGGAKSLLAGKGFSINGNPITHFPPLYPFFLAASGLLENNLVQAARFLNAFLFGVNVGLLALSVYLAGGRNFLTTTIAAFFFLSSGPLINLHAMAWTEPLFITFLLACIILLCLYVIKPSLSMLIASSLFLGLSIVTRYVGIAFIPAALLIVFMNRRELNFGRRFLNALIYLAFTCSPLVILFTRNLIVARSATNRSFIMHPVPVLQFLSKLFQIVFDFFAPISLPAGVRAAIFGLITIFLIVQILIFSKQHFKDILWHPLNWRTMGIVMPISCLLFSISYVLFLYISISSFDAATPVDARILSPLLIILIVGVFSALWTVLQTSQ